MVIKCQSGYNKIMHYNTTSHITPPFYLKNPVLQTVLSSIKIRNRGITPFELESREVLVDAGGGVRLTGFISSHDTSRETSDSGKSMKKTDNPSSRLEGQRTLRVHGRFGAVFLSARL